MQKARLASIASAITIAAGGGLIAIHHLGGTPGDTEGWFASTGFGAPFIGAGLLGLLAVLKSCPLYCAAAGLALPPMCIISVIGFPLLIPAGMLIVVALANEVPVREMALAAIPALALAATTWFLVLHQDPVTWTTATSSGGSSNIITSFEATLSITVVTIVLAACYLLSPRGQPLPSR